MKREGAEVGGGKLDLGGCRAGHATAVHSNGFVEERGYPLAAGQPLRPVALGSPVRGRSSEPFEEPAKSPSGGSFVWPGRRRSQPPWAVYLSAERGVQPPPLGPLADVHRPAEQREESAQERSPA